MARLSVLSVFDGHGWLIFQSLWKNCKGAFWGFAVEFFGFEGRENFEAVGDAAEGGVFAVKVRGGVLT